MLHVSIHNTLLDLITILLKLSFYHWKYVFMIISNIFHSTYCKIAKKRYTLLRKEEIFSKLWSVEY